MSSSAPGRPASEFDLLCACCCVSEAELSQYIHPGLNWDRTLKLASFHRVLPALHASLKEREDVPASILSALDARFTAHLKRVLRFSAELAGIMRRFEERGVEVLCHKGPALAQQLYGDPAAREFGDLDFIVRTSDVERTRAILCELGYAPKLTLSPRQRREYLCTGYEYVFGSAAEPNLVELQWQILPGFYAIDFEMASFFGRAVEINFEGRRMCALCNNDLILVLCVHAAKHGWPHLGMLRDIAALTHAGIDWATTINEAARLGILKILATSVELARRLFGIRMPEQAAARLSAAHNSASIEDILLRMREGVEMRTDSYSYLRTMMDLRERRSDQIRFAWRFVTTPTPAEWQMADLSNRLFPLYRVARLWRLLKRGFARRKSSLTD